MTVVEKFRLNGENSKDLWASVVLNDGTIFEGVVESEKPYGIYLKLGGDPNRLSMFPWTVVVRVVLKAIE